VTQPIRLTPLVCIRCQTPILAQPNEVAWVCTQCGQGQILSNEASLKSLDIHYAANLPSNGPARPFWVAEGQVTLGERKTYSGNEAKEAGSFWQAPRRFFIPAFALPLDQVIAVGTQLLRTPPDVTATQSAAPFAAVTILPQDVRPYAEFIVLGIEADRKDKLRSIQFDIRLGEPQLWVLP